MKLPPDPDALPPPHHHQGIFHEPKNIYQGLFSGNTNVVQMPVSKVSSPLPKPRSV